MTPDATAADLEALRIPRTGTHPTEPYIASLCTHSTHHPTVPVTLTEARMIRCYVEWAITWYEHGGTLTGFVDRWSGPHAPYAAVDGHRTVTLLKRGPRDWAYRRAGQELPPFWPDPPTGDVQPLDLPAVLDHVATLGGLILTGWVRWKTEHPDVFPTSG